jgi:FtsP/CotA-like multicopper oxidase with cupredoxin domain
MRMTCKMIVISRLLLFLSLCGHPASGDPAGVDPDASVCPRPAAGRTIRPPAEVSSAHGRLHAAFAFRSQVDDDGLTRYCYISENNIEAPTLRVKPGDEIVLDLRNELTVLPDSVPETHRHSGSDPGRACSAGPMTGVSTNLHFHGLAIPPVCHQDEVIHTAIQPSDPAFQYRFRIPAGQPSGLYWYHPHPHGYSEGQVLGGASGALIVEGIEKAKPQVAGLPERVLILRDQIVPGQTSAADSDDNGAKDISLNFVPVRYPLYMPAVMRVQADQREFWRVLNASADTYFVLQVVSVRNGQRVPENLPIIAMDGVPVGEEVNAAPHGEILISPGARAEFIVTTPAAGSFTQLVSRSYETGPDGQANPYRVIANIISTHGASADSKGSSQSPAGTIQVETNHAFRGLAGIHPDRERRLYFSEDREDLRIPGKPAKYFITVVGAEPKVFDMNIRDPDVTVRQGTVEDWIIENRAREAHVFHIHQLHFQLIERDGVKASESALRDTIDLPYWDGKSDHYPSARLRMDFRAPEIVGTFLFHCHILEHEDAGMMGSVKVVRR